MERIRCLPRLWRKIREALEGPPRSDRLDLRGEGKTTLGQMDHFLKTGEVPPHLQEAPQEEE